jgi:hypothetical protein
LAVVLLLQVGWQLDRSQSSTFMLWQLHQQQLHLQAVNNSSLPVVPE